MKKFSLLQLIQNPILKIYVLDNQYEAFYGYCQFLKIRTTITFLWNIISFFLLEETANFQCNYYIPDWNEIEEVLLEYQDRCIACCPSTHYVNTETYFVTIQIRRIVEKDHPLKKRI